MTLNYPIPSLFTVPQIKTTPHLHIHMALFMALEGVWVEKGFAAGGAHQPHSQVHLVHRWWHVRLMEPLCSPKPGIYIPT